MVVQNTDVICEGVLEKKVERRKFSLGSAWKQKYCVLNSDALLIYGSKTNTSRPTKTIPLCHMKNINRLREDNENKIFFFNVETEQGEVLSFRSKEDKGWAANIQIQLIHYKNRQDILRYKQLISSMKVLEAAKPRPSSTTISPNNNQIMDPVIIERLKKIHCAKGCRVVILQNCKTNGVGIGITVIPLHDGRIVVNRVLDGGPAMKLGSIHSHDEIVSANGHPVTSVDMLSTIVRASPDSVILVIKPRIIKPSPVFDNPKRSLKEEGNHQTEIIDKLKPSDKIIETRRQKSSPKHFRFV